MMNDFIEENKKMIVLALVLVGLCIFFGLINFFMEGGSKKTTPEKALKELGQIYYEELFYPNMVEQEVYESMIDKYKESGFKVTLLKLLNSIDDAKEEIFDNDKVYCRVEETYVIIYPTGYNKKDYKIEVHTSC